MKSKYEILIEGSNLRMKMNTKIEKFGYFTTRYIEAYNESDASDLAFAAIKKELSEENFVLNAIDDPHLMVVAEIREVLFFENEQTQGKGFSFFIDEAEDRKS